MLKRTNCGVAARVPMVVMDPFSSRVRHAVEARYSQSPHHRRLDRRDVTDDGQVTTRRMQETLGISQKRLELRVHPSIHRGERLAPAKGEVVAVLEAAPLLGRDRTHRLPVEVAVVDLDKGLRHRRFKVRQRQGRRLAGPRQRRHPHFFYSPQVRHQRSGLALAQGRQVRVTAPHQEAVGVGGRLTVADQR